MPGRNNPGWAVFVDFDGTITDRDTFDVLVPLFAGDGAWEESERGLDAGTRSLRDVLARQASYVRGTHAEIAALLRREIRVDATFAPFARRCRADGVPLSIVSSGVESIIRDRLDEIGLDDIPVIANAADAREDGWVLRFRDDVPNGTDKAAVIRAARERGRRTAFVGDGRSDYAAALGADLRLAKRGLALERFLTNEGVAFDAFASFAEVTERFVALGILRAGLRDLSL